MAKIKYSKTELKHQRDALRRFQRYLPTLLLKKQQLQLEVRNLDHEIERKSREEHDAREDLRSWVKLFASPVPLEDYLRISGVRCSVNNIAGVNVPVLDEISFDRTAPDLFLTDPWLDDAIEMLEKLSRLRIERLILDEQHRLLEQELRVTTQRVNLFEKVKIPETKENIRVIRIFLGDQQTAEVARAKLAKGRAVKSEGAQL